LDTAGAILVLEDLGMKPYQVDRALLHLQQAGKFSGVKAIILGEFPNGDAPAPNSPTTRDVCARILSPLGIPVIYGAPVGHSKRAMLTLPLGIRARLRAHGCDAVTVSTGQTVPYQKPVYGRLYQTPFSDRIRHEAGIVTMTVGNLSTYADANSNPGRALHGGGPRPDGADGILQHFERTDAGPVLCRSEDFVPVHAGLRRLLCEGPLVEVAGALLGEPAVLYKEKINYKLQGGAGYSPHQDAPAYPMIDVHVSAMVAVDDADGSNGGLELVSGCFDTVFPLADAGTSTLAPIN
jgi:hypothetical protein